MGLIIYYNLNAGQVPIAQAKALARQDSGPACA
jgi:hypothetical protein